MASSPLSLLFPNVGSVTRENGLGRSHGTFCAKDGHFLDCGWLRVSATRNSRESKGDADLIKRREAIGMALGASSLVLVDSFHLDAQGAGLPPEQKPMLCDDTCEKELENVAANYVAMVPSGQIFDSSLERGQPYIFRVGSGQT